MNLILNNIIENYHVFERSKYNYEQTHMTKISTKDVTITKVK